MPNNDYANEPNQSRSEEIIQSILDNTEYDEAARSRIEYLLIELKNAIEGGGGGGGVTSYSPLTEKPKIDNHTLQAGNNTSSDLGLQTKLTFDSTPTENSTNPVTSGGVCTALGTKANSSDVYNKSAVDTALGAKADKSTTYTKTEVDTALSSKQNTISDLSTIRSGAALGTTAVQPVTGKGLSANDYTDAEKSKLAGIEAQANKTTVDSALSGTSANPVQNKVVKSALDGKQASLTIAQLAAVNSGVTAEKLTRDENNILFNTNNGVKNLLNIRTGTEIVNGVTFTFNADKTVTVSGTATGGTANLNICSFTADEAYALNGKILSGCPANGSDSTYKMQLQRNSSPWTVYAKDIGNETTISGVAQATCILLISIAEGQTVNLTFKPMIRQFGDNTYQPYAMSNAELTASLLPTIYAAPTVSSQYGVTVGSGGYCRIGNICVVSIRLTNDNQIPNGNNFVYGLPLPAADSGLGAGSSVVTLACNKSGVFAAVTNDGNIANVGGSAIAAGTTFVLSGVYLIKQS